VKLQFDNACEAAGVEDVQMRDLRAVAATEAKKQGKDPRALLGHTTDQQTQRYLRDKEEPLVEGPSFGRLIDSDS
jgi:integrase